VVLCSKEKRKHKGLHLHEGQRRIEAGERGKRQVAIIWDRLRFSIFDPLPFPPQYPTPKVPGEHGECISSFVLWMEFHPITYG